MIAFKWWEHVTSKKDMIAVNMGCVHWSIDTSEEGRWVKALFWKK
ncbi:hypothetical protein M2454_002179 [Aequitasia blattaphilus]|nr:hypothetical protein [Aequitasia blattaphilus]